MNICHVSLDYPLPKPGGGVGTYVMLTSRHLVAQGHQIHVIAFSDNGQTHIVHDQGVRVHLIPRTSLHWYIYKLPVIGSASVLAVRELEWAWAVWRYVEKLHQEHPIDVIEITERAGLFLALFMRQVPQLARLHGEEYTFQKYTPALGLSTSLRLCRVIQRAAMRRSILLVANTRSHAQEIVTELGEQHPPVRRVPCCFDTARGTRAKIEPVQPRSNRILFVGRLEHRKGVPLLLKAFRRVLDQQPDAELVFVGAPHSTLSWTEIHTIVQANGLGEQVHFVGHVSSDEVHLWYSQATVCVLPSYYETFGLAAVEPMGFGVPVVATTAGGLPEVVEDDVTGILVPPGDAGALAEAILALLRDSDLRRRMGEAGKKRALSEFSVEVVARQMSDLYQQLIDGKKPQELAGSRFG